MAYNFNTTYALDPWDGITQNERTWYDGQLRETYVRRAVYSPYATMKVNMNENVAREIVFNELIPPRPYIGTIGNRAMDASRLYTDSYQKRVTTQR